MRRTCKNDEETPNNSVILPRALTSFQGNKAEQRGAARNSATARVLNTYFIIFQRVQSGNGFYDRVDRTDARGHRPPRQNSPHVPNNFIPTVQRLAINLSPDDLSPGILFPTFT